MSEPPEDQQPDPEGAQNLHERMRSFLFTAPPTDAAPVQPPPQITATPATLPDPDKESEDRDTDKDLAVAAIGPMLRRTPMLDLFTTVSVRRFGHRRQRNPIAECKAAHPKFFWACVTVDFLFRVAAYVLLLLAVWYIIRKTLGS